MFILQADDLFVFVPKNKTDHGFTMPRALGEAGCEGHVIRFWAYRLSGKFENATMLHYKWITYSKAHSSYIRTGHCFLNNSLE
jgi:hypothetical protein